MPNNMEADKHYLSQEKFDELNKELDNLKTVRRREIAERLEFAKSLGDLAENSEYHAAREEQADAEDRINELDGLLRLSEIIGDRHSGTIGVGSSLVVKKVDSDEEINYKIVGSEEVDLGSNRISYQSPLGSCLLNRKKGEEVKVQTPKGEVAYQIVKVS